MLTRLPTFALLCLPSTTTAFAPSTMAHRTATARYGYLDDLSKELYAPDGSSSMEEIDTDSMKMNKEDVDRFGVGSWDDFVEFDEFDGGDGTKESWESRGERSCRIDGYVSHSFLFV